MAAVTTTMTTAPSAITRLLPKARPMRAVRELLKSTSW